MSYEPSWNEDLRRSIRDPQELATFLQLTLDQLPALCANTPFAFLVPKAFAERMHKGDPHDPLLRQVWPDQREQEVLPEERLDPVGDHNARAQAGMLQKYHGRALLVLTGSCAINCRYCFRQNWPYTESPRSLQEWEPVFAQIEADPTIQEVILSGGDPLTRPDSVLAEWYQRLEQIPSVRTVRIHSRLPVVLPSRVTENFCSVLQNSRLQTCIVVHCNHAQEIDEAVHQAVRQLRTAGATVLNQSVLLAGINDSVEALEALSRALWHCGILPYYLHALDPVAGSARFAVPDALAVALIAQLRCRLPGYLVPRLVREIPGEPSKTPLGIAEDF